MSVSATVDLEHYAGGFDWALWRRALRHLGPYRRQIAGLAFCGLVIALVEGVFPWVTGLLIDEATAHGVTRRLTWLAGGYLALFVIFAACVWRFILLAGRTATGIAYDLREQGFARLQSLSFSYFDKRSVGWLVTRMTSDCRKVSELAPWFTLDLVWGSSCLATILVAMFLLSWKLALVVLVVVPPMAIVSAYFQSRLLESSRKVRRSNSILTAAFNECIMGVRTTKVLGRESGNLEEFQVESTAMYDHSMRNALQSAVYLPAVITLGSLGVGLAIWQGGLQVPTGDLSVGTLVAFMQYAAFFAMPIQELARRFTDLQAAQAAAERVQSLLDTEPEITDGPDVVAALAASQQGQRAEGIAEDGHLERIGRLEFRNVSFAYIENEPVLKDVSFTVDAGETVALVGPTGGGKSTIVSLAARFYEVTDGAILVDGVDLRARGLHWLQSNLGVVLQTPHLFSGTVRENIAYGDLAASDDAIEAAAKLVNAHDFIMALDGGYASEVGEGGSRLSTGQRQLVSLARAVLADPQIFIMDEATSSVDTETEGLIQDAIETVLEGRIAFVIAHRLSTIRNADTILVIDQGEIVERGNHEELLAKQGRYHGLYTKQFAREME